VPLLVQWVADTQIHLDESYTTFWWGLAETENLLTATFWQNESKHPPMSVAERSSHYANIINSGFIPNASEVEKNGVGSLTYVGECYSNPKLGDGFRIVTEAPERQPFFRSPVVSAVAVAVPQAAAPDLVQLEAKLNTDWPPARLNGNLRPDIQILDLAKLNLPPNLLIPPTQHDAAIIAAMEAGDFPGWFQPDRADDQTVCPKPSQHVRVAELRERSWMTKMWTEKQNALKKAIEPVQNAHPTDSDMIRLRTLQIYVAWRWPMFCWKLRSLWLGPVLQQHAVKRHAAALNRFDGKIADITGRHPRGLFLLHEFAKTVGKDLLTDAQLE
jgi:hypothetical protein